jgi:tetratricopeptide (TPR) repeat protein
MKHSLVGALLVLALSPAALAISPEDVQQRWDEANFALQGDARETAMAALVKDCNGAGKAGSATDAELLTWCGIASSSYAALVSPLFAMKYAKRARAELQRAIDAQPAVLHGAAQTSLGTLYYKVPGWPLGFGDRGKARELLRAGLAADPRGMDSNYFYADFLAEHGEWSEARKYLQQASDAAPRPGRELADQGRRAEIASLLEKVDRHLDDH